MKIIYEGVLKDAKNKVKDFFKKEYKSVKKKAKDIFKQLKQDFMSPKMDSNFTPGKFLSYKYNAKDKTKRFDKAPLGICLGRSKKNKSNFYLINFHWLPLKERASLASFFAELNKRTGNRLEYKDVKPFLSKFEGHPCLRQYIIKRVSNKVIEINDTEQFITAASLPSEIWFTP